MSGIQQVFQVEKVGVWETFKEDWAISSLVWR
jgi:hypothetical protein